MEKQSDKFKQYITELKNVHRNRYLDVLNISGYEAGKTGKVVKSFISSRLLQSMKNRIVSDIPTIRYNFITEKTDLICTAFKITRNDLTSIYAYLYSKSAGNNHFEHMFFCIGGALNSKDGEYRSNFQKYNKIQKLKAKYPERYSFAEEFITDQMEEKLITFFTDIFYPSGFAGTSGFENNIVESRIAIELFVFAWLLDFHRIDSKTIENHINPAYQSIIYNNGDDADVYKLISGSFTNPDEFDKFISDIVCYRIDLENPKYHKCVRTGQKLFPATINEIYNINDINFPIWRELYVSLNCFNLVLNCISPGFPYVNNWFFVQNIHPGLFDNASQYAKFDYSEIAKGISMNLAEQDRLNYINITDTITAPINAKFENLSAKMNKAINYAESSIILSDIAICFHMEHVGRTFIDIPYLEKNIPSFAFSEHIFSDVNLFDKHIFEYIYSLYMMNTKLNIIHGDIHANNITIYKFRDYDYSQIVSNRIRTKIAYIIGENYYMFNHIMTFSMLIDFSRAILGNISKIRDDFGPKYAEIYMKNQSDRILRIIHHYFPGFAEKNKNNIRVAILSDFPGFFKAFTAIDPYILTLNIHKVMKDKFPALAKRVSKIRDLSEKLLLTGISDVIAGKPEDSTEWPLLTIITEIFTEYFNTELSADDLVIDIFNGNNDVKYDIFDPTKTPDTISLDDYIELRTKYGIPLEPEVSEWQQYIKKNENNSIEILLNKQKRREKINTKSSWELD